jgi:putative transposase
MDNHIHVIWQLHAGRKRQDVQRDFLQYTAQQIKKDMLKNHSDQLEDYIVDAKDRKYQFWERNPLTVEIWSEKILLQKLKYMHENPVRAGVCNSPMIINIQRCFINSKSTIGVS